MSNVETMESPDRFTHDGAMGQADRAIVPGASGAEAPGMVGRAGDQDAVGFPLISQDPVIQARYIAMREAGESHSMAEILASRSFPGLRTDAIYNKNRCNGNQFEDQPWLGDYYRGLAEASGVNTTGKYYSRALADYPGDPTAWVSDRSDVLRVCREKGFRCTGMVDYEPPEIEAPMPDVQIAGELVEEEIERRLALAPGLSREDVYDDALNTRLGKTEAPAWEPKGPDISEAFREEV